jgi:hypothetical protein
VETATADDRHEREITRDVALDERADRRELSRKYELAQEQITRLSVMTEVFRSERDQAREERDELRIQFSLQSQLVEKQRAQFDALVKRLMEGPDTQ